MESKTHFNKQLWLLLLLRIFIGWQFLYEGIIKVFNSSWSAEGYLTYSNWIFSDAFHSMASNPAILSIVNFCNIWGLILIGLALLLGICTRAAAISGAALLLLYYVANPPFTLADSMKEGSYMIIDKNMIEIISLLIVAFLPTPSLIRMEGIKRWIQSFGSRLTPAPEYPCQAAGCEDKKITERRNFIFSLASASFTGLFTWGVIKTKAFKPPLTDTLSGATLRVFNFSELSDLKGTLPYAKIGNIELSRLFMGCNLIGGWTHSRDLIYVSSLVKKYHTREKIFDTLQLAEQCGINGIILNTSLTPIINDYWKERRGKIQFMSDCAFVGDVETGIKVSMDAGAATCYIQGEITEQLLRERGDFTIVGEWMEKIRRYGVPAGIGAHSLDVIKRCVNLGIKPDYWVKTLHQNNYWSARPDEERHDNNWCGNPEETIAYMNHLEEPWVAFKVLAAGAIRPEEGFKYAFEGGADFICVGMYDFQIVDDVNIVVKIFSDFINRQRPWRC